MPTLIVCKPVPIWKVMFSGPGSALAPRIACRREPGPLSFVFVTTKIGVPVTTAQGENSDVLPAGSVAATVMI